jgi:hypothetical protein
MLRFYTLLIYAGRIGTSSFRRIFDAIDFIDRSVQLHVEIIPAYTAN